MSNQSPCPKNPEATQCHCQKKAPCCGDHGNEKQKNRSLLNSLMAGIPGAILMGLMAGGIVMAPWLMGLIAAATLVIIMVSSHNILTETWKTLTRKTFTGERPISVDFFFGFSAILCWTVSVVALATGLVLPIVFETALLLLAIRHLGHWLKHRMLSAFPEQETIEQQLSKLEACSKGKSYTITPGLLLPVSGTIRAEVKANANDDSRVVDGPVWVKTTNANGNLFYTKIELNQPITLPARSVVISGSGTFIPAEDFSPQTLRRTEEDTSRDELWVRRALAWYMPFVVLAAIVTFTVWSLLASPLVAMTAAMAVLVVSCPCAMGFSIQAIKNITMMKAKSYGITFRKGVDIDKLGDATELGLDITGTLTEITIEKIEITEQDHDAKLNWLLAVQLAILAQNPDNPYAKKIIAYFNKSMPNVKPVPTVQVKDVKMDPNSLTATLVIDPEQNTSPEHTITITRENPTSLVWRVNDQSRAIISLTEVLKEETLPAIERLKTAFNIIGLSGGSEKKIADIDQLGIKITYGLTPQNKASLITKSHAFCGDGGNDEPAKQKAGVSMGFGPVGSDQVTLEDHSIMRVMIAKLLANRNRNTIRISLIFSLGYNALGIFLAAGGLMLFTGMMLHPLVAACMMVGSFVILSVIAWHLYCYEPKEANAFKIDPTQAMPAVTTHHSPSLITTQLPQNLGSSQRSPKESAHCCAAVQLRQTDD